MSAEAAPVEFLDPAERRLLEVLEKPGMKVLVSVQGGEEERVELDRETLDVFRAFIAHREGECGEMTPPQAAEYLGVSRPHVVKLVKEGVLPHHMVGAHYRIPTRAVLAYGERRKRERRELAARATAEARELGLYEDPVS